MPTERSVLVRLDANPRGFILGMEEAKAAVRDLRKDIDTTNDRTAWLAQSFLALGPALGPLSAAAVPALAGIATQLTITGVAAGTATLAFNGIGDALKALNDYQIDPTDAHLKKLHQTMAFIGPSGRDLVRVLDQMRDKFIGLADLSRDKMFPGVIDGLHELADLGPRVEQIVAKTAAELGNLARRAGEGLAGPQFADFFKFLEAEAVPTLDAMGRVIGNITLGLADMLVAFKPLSDDFTKGMLNMSRAFADWAGGLRNNDSFQQFIDYVREQTPRVLDLLGTLADTFVDIVRAASPVGEVMIPLLDDFLKIVDAIANSPLGPIFIAAAAAMSLYGRAIALGSVTTRGLTVKILELSGVLRRYEAEAGRAAAASESIGTAAEAGATKAQAAGAKYAVSWKRAAGGAGLFGLALSPLPEKLHLTGAAYGALAGSIAGPGGTIFGAITGEAIALSGALVKGMTTTEKFTGDTATLASTLDQQTGAITANTKAFVENELAQKGVLAAAQRIGVSSDLIVDAYLGDQIAIYKVNEALDGFQLKAGLSADQADKYRGALELLSSVLGAGKTDLDKAREGMLLTGDAVDTTRRKFQRAKVDVDRFGDAVDALGEKLDNRSKWASYQAAIDDLARGFRKDENGLSLDFGSQKGRANQANLSAFAQAVSDQAGQLSGQERADFLKGALQQFDRLIGKLHLSKDRVKELKENLGLLDLVKVDPLVKVGHMMIAESHVKALERGLKNLDGLVANPRVIVTELYHATSAGNMFGSRGGFAEGGWTGSGGKYEPAGIVHKGEFVVPAPFAERDRAMLERMYLPGYANGGFVQAPPAAPVMVSGPSIDYDQLTGAILAARPTHGDVHVYGDNSYEREMRQTRRTAALGGRPQR